MVHKLVLGIDEAGYGPSMGPFVVIATAWRVPQAIPMEQLHDLLAPEIQPTPLNLKVQAKKATHVPLGDSKKIYSGRFAWENLCDSAHFLLENIKDHPSAASGNHAPRKSKMQDDSLSRDAGARLFPQDWARVKNVPWFRDLQIESPKEQSPEELGLTASPVKPTHEARDAARRKIQSLGIELVTARGRLIDEIEWNRLLEHFQNKSSVLSELTLGLARDVAHDMADAKESIEIYCDKHGGRNRYQSLLMNAFEDQWFETHAETNKLSRYSTRWAGHPLMIQFRVEGDSLIPSAAASILAKWTRERAMKALNEFWDNQANKHGMPRPKPTAGYYVDATRFAADIEELAVRHGPQKSRWWRVK